jgi:hypothetical protein
MFELDYNALIHLDAEELAEAGIGEAYNRILPSLNRFVRQPETIDEGDVKNQTQHVRGVKISAGVR